MSVMRHKLQSVDIKVTRYRLSTTPTVPCYMSLHVARDILLALVLLGSTGHTLYNIDLIFVV